MNEIEAWVRDHEPSLREIAEETHLPPGLVNLAAASVLVGAEDDEIFRLLSEHVVSSNGEDNPLAGAPPALTKIRRLASA